VRRARTLLVLDLGLDLLFQPTHARAVSQVLPPLPMAGQHSCGVPPKVVRRCSTATSNVVRLPSNVGSSAPHASLYDLPHPAVLWRKPKPKHNAWRRVSSRCETHTRQHKRTHADESTR
jgi:hypothetical protein